MERIRVLVVDDNRAFLEAAVALLADDPMIDVVGKMTSPNEAIGRLATLRLDVVLLELEMSEMSGLLAALHVKAMPDAPKVVLVTDHDEPIYRKLALGLHVDAFVRKRRFHETALPAIKALFSKQTASWPASDADEIRRVSR